MNQQLERQLIEQPLQQSTQTTANSQSSSHVSLNMAYNTNFVRIKLYVLIIMATIFIFYRLFSSSLLEGCISDLSHEWTVTLNRLINENELFYQIVIIIAQQTIQINIICLCVVSTWKVKNLKGHLYLSAFFLIRVVFLNIEGFPYPNYYRWEAPWLPSMTVPYGVTRDYFYSGHTGVMLFSTIFWKDLGFTKFYYMNILLTPFVITVLLSTRVHYSIDVIAATIFTLWINVFFAKYVYYFDKLWSNIFLVIQKIISKIRTFFQ